MPSLPIRECGDWNLHAWHKYRFDDRDHMCPGVPGDPPIDPEERVIDTRKLTTRDAADDFLRHCGLDPSPDAIDALVEKFLPTLRNMSDSEYEEVDHPAHYGGDTPYEVIKVLEAWSDMFHMPVNLTSAIKYLSRAGRKPGVPAKLDLEKAIWHIQREINRDE